MFQLTILETLSTLSNLLIKVNSGLVTQLNKASHVQVFATPWTVAFQAPPSMGLSWQEYWSGLPVPSPGDLPNPVTEPTSTHISCLAGRFFTPEPPGKSGGI